MKITFGGILLCLCCISLSGCGVKYVSITYKVIDEQGAPIKGAIVNHHYRTEHNRTGTTDKNGIYTYRNILSVPEMSVLIKKDGYYSSWDSAGPIDLYLKKNNGQKIIKLIKKINPVKMYAKELRLKLPIENGEVGYDLVVGDFVGPYGDGKISDFIFHVSSESKSNHLKNITFSNQDDGIQPFFVKSRSRLFAGHKAPMSGYLSSWKEADDLGYKLYIQDGHQADDRLRGTTTYYFRVRSQKDGTAMYGFIKMLFWGVYPHIYLDYYLNADRTNNIEYGGSHFSAPSQKDESYYLPEIPD